jgi:hypothetical protein
LRKGAYGRLVTGRWTILKDARANRIVYRLNLENPARVVSFFRADDNILMFLDSASDVRVGNDSFSYTLNRSSETS